MMNCRLGQTARAFARNFYNPHGQSSKFLVTRRKALFFPPIVVKRVRLEEARPAYRMLPATWAGGANSPAAAADNFDDLGEDAYH